LPTFFTGHVADGAPARSGHHEHLFFLADDADGDGHIDRLALIAPHMADRTVAYDSTRRSATRDHLRLLDRALAGMTLLRAGRAGAPSLARAPEPGDDDPIFGGARAWVSRTLYRPTRHPRRDAAEAAVAGDLVEECGRRGLPRPDVEIIEVKIGPRGGVLARARLRFQVAVTGPLLLGRGSHVGAGMFGIETQ
jgi:CRISPR-associated protein Csb2